MRIPISKVIALSNGVNPFKPGDKVICVCDEPANAFNTPLVRLGEEYTIRVAEERTVLVTELTEASMFWGRFMLAAQTAKQTVDRVLDKAYGI